MPDLNIQVQEVKGLPGTAMVVLNGSIDANTVITFQTQLNTVRERGISRFILDMENVKYVNSTGLGYLINLSDSVSGKGGISLVRVQPKVKVVFDMLGLNAFFKIYATRDEALKHFTEEPIATPTEQTAVLKAGLQAGAQPPPPPTVRVAPPAHHAPAAEHAGRGGAAVAAPAVVAAPPSDIPADAIHVECQGCKAALAVKEVGTYKCPRCLTLFNYVGGGKASFLPRRKNIPVQLSLNFSDDCTQGLLEFVRISAKRAGFSEPGLVELSNAVRDTVGTIRQHAYGGNDNNVYHVMLVTTDSEVEIRFADYGTSLSPNRTDGSGRNLFHSARALMDRFELKNHPKGGNVLTLSKKAK